MAKTDEEKLHIIHSIIGWAIALFVVALLIVFAISSPKKSEEDYRKELMERYQKEYDACVKSMMGKNVLIERQTGKRGDYFCSSIKFIEDNNGHATEVIIYYYKGLGQGKEIFFREKLK